jgi:CHASE2 domain-containing sensor protein
LDIRIFYRILQIISIIGILIISYFWVWDEQLVKVITFFVMVVVITLLVYYFFNKRFKRDNKDE